MPKSTGEDWFGIPDLARFLGVTVRTVYTILDTGDLPAFRIGRVIRVRRADVEDFLERNKIRPGELRHLHPPNPQRRSPSTD